ncbi:MAG: MBL fold metallo-hydrolase [Eubacteriales bacterium]|nr:MBL fold metallo-hydrolase [Eubacteriales bacterium]
MEKIFEFSSLAVYAAEVNTVAILAENNMLVIDPGLKFTLPLSDHVDIICHCYSRIYTSAASGIPGARIYVPQSQAELFTNPEIYWEDFSDNWRLMDFNPGHAMCRHGMRIFSTLGDQDTLQWQGLSIRVLETPGMEKGNLSFLFNLEGKKVCFAGNLFNTDSTIDSIVPMQESVAGLMGYHSMMGTYKLLLSSLERISAEQPDILITSHGRVLLEPQAAIHQTMEKLTKAIGAFAFCSSLNHFFPDLYSDVCIKLHEICSETLPANIIRVPNAEVVVRSARNEEYLTATSFLIISENKRGFLIDCGSEAVTDSLRCLVSNGTINGLDGCYITHYHHDHVDGLPKLKQYFDVPIYADRIFSDILENPENYRLPCLSPNSIRGIIPTDRGEVLRWNEYVLTFYWFPGQTLYHGGLMLRDCNRKVFFCGDSFTPSGFDNYCVYNRNFLGEEEGYSLCLDLLKPEQPNMIINQHLEEGFTLNKSDYDCLDESFKNFKEALGNLLSEPINDGVDPYAARTYPFLCRPNDDGILRINVEITNHLGTDALFTIVPEYFEGSSGPREKTLNVPGHSSGTVLTGYGTPDGSVTFEIACLKSAEHEPIFFHVYRNDVFLTSTYAVVDRRSK